MKSKKSFILGMILLLIVQLGAVIYFGGLKQGFHYDEYYSYYSSNVTYGLNPTDMEWKDTEEIKSEFMVLPDAGVSYGTVKMMQSWDVHPPLYYYVLHTVCALTKGIFSKWQGLSVNILFFVLSWLTLAFITKEITGNDKKKIAMVCTLFGFSPAIFSGIMFIRMYMMLTFLCLLLLYVHVRAIVKEKRTAVGFYLPVMLISFSGFHTHYYFAVFLFFMAAAVSLYLFFHKETRKTSFVYAASVLSGMFLSVLVYPACLSHIFRGYRGTEAQDAFFDIGNIGQRLGFFFDLTNEYVFGGMLVELLLVAVLLGITRKAVDNMYGTFKKNSEDLAGKASEKPDCVQLREKKAFVLTAIVSLGYFLVVAKTALLNAEEAIRYEMPVYGLLIMLIIIYVDNRAASFENVKNKKWIRIVVGVLAVLTLTGQIMGLATGKVCFLYPQDKQNVAWAQTQKDTDVVYIYNPTNQWMIWDESEELMQYEQIYFVSSENEEVIADNRLSETEHVYVYMMRGERAEAAFEKVVEENGGFTDIKLIRELLYCDLYELKR